jgi:hypothetical protein
MARIITKELAEKIVAKLKAVKVKSRSKSHDFYDVEHEGQVIASISIRRGSEKDKGHDYIPHDLRVSPRQAKLLAQCPWKHEDYIQALREKGLLAEVEEEEENAGE